MKKSADETLSERIIAKLKAEALLSEEELGKLAKAYGAGRISIEDWIMRIESSSGKEKKDGKKN